jgi:ribosomal-protein-alanine N-acetyltransferase
MLSRPWPIGRFEGVSRLFLRPASSPLLSSLSPFGRLDVPGPQPEIVGLGPEDLLACLSLDRQALGGLWTEDQWLKELIEPQRPVVGWRQGGGLLALASGWIVVDELHITAVAVHPDHRRVGLGRRVMEALLRQAQLAGAERATLEVSAANGAARALYAALGFKEVAVRHGYYRNGEDALIQWKRLS